MQIQLDNGQPYYQLTDWFEDAELVAALRACIEAQMNAAATARQQFKPDAEALQKVSPEALTQILEAGEDIHGIAKQRDISNVIAFNSSAVADAVNSDDVQRLRAVADRMVADKLRAMLNAPASLNVACSGHFWYPPGAYMSWHTNSGVPGWRIYLTHSREPGQSFFRYRDPATGEVITSHDHQWDVRLFRIDREVPLWHSVYSQTDRFSLGYLVHDQPWWKPITRRLRSLVGR